MSKFMLSDDDSINDVNPFVKHDFSLPGSVGQTAAFDNFTKSSTGGGNFDTDESVYCSFGLCQTQQKPTTVFSAIHPRRNIDTGFTCDSSEKVKVGVAKEEKIPYFGMFLGVVFISLVVSYARQ
jgi:hypothetical protein